MRKSILFYAYCFLILGFLASCGEEKEPLSLEECRDMEQEEEVKKTFESMNELFELDSTYLNEVFQLYPQLEGKEDMFAKLTDILNDNAI